MRPVIILFAAVVLFAPAAAGAEMPYNLKFGGQFRVRGEATNVTSYATQAGRNPTDFVLYRTRLNAEAEPGKGVRTFIQLQDSRTSGSAPGTNNQNVDLHQGYLDILDLWGLPLSLRAGRWGMSYGDQRLISTLDWSNVGRAWDGIRIRAGNDIWNVDLFSTNVKEVDKSVHDHRFSGLYAACKAVEKHEMDVYFLGRDLGDGIQTNEDPDGAGPRTAGTGNLTERTLGTRIKGRTGMADYSGEFVYQFGFAAGDRIQAHALALTAGVNAPVAMQPRLGFEWTYASGDSDPNDGKEETFSPLYPFSHALQGHADVFNWRNGHDFAAHLKLVPVAGLNSFVSYHHFRLEHARDSWYGGAAIATDATGTSGKHVGDEIDIHFKTKFRDTLNLWFGVAQFFPGEFAKKTVAARDKTFGFIQAVLDF
ncbi:MAG: alginate export family protein [Elusimicrobiota bacterium]